MSDVKNERACLQEKDIKAMRQELSDGKSDIRVIEHNIISADKRIDTMQEKYETMNDLNTAISVMSLTLDHIVEHNERQDKLQENQSETMASQMKTMENINQNLNELNQGQRHLNSKVAQLEERVDESEKKSMVDLRDVEKEKQTGILKKYGAPVGIGVGLGTTLALIVLEVLKAVN